MGIAGLTDRNKSFMCLAKVKKGDVVKTADGKSTKPVDLTHWRIVYKDGSQDVEGAFKKLYGDKPISIDMRLPFAVVQECWDAYLTCYGKGGKMATASTLIDDHGNEVLKWEYYRDHATSEVWIRNGHAICDEGVDLMAKPFGVKDIVYTYKNDRGEMVDVFLKPEGRLNFVVPGLAYVDGKPRPGYFEFCPTSPRDIGTISAELSAISFMAEQVGKDITGIPMKLIRRKENVTVNIKGKLSKKDSWVVHVVPGGEWAGKALEAMEVLSLPGPAPVYDIEDEDIVEGQSEDVEEGSAPKSAPIQRPAPAARQPAPAPAPAPIPSTRYTDPMPEDDWVPPDEFGGSSAAPTAQTVPAPAPTPAKPAETGEIALVRPYDPLVLKAKINEIIEKLPALYEKNKVDISVPAPIRNVLAATIDGVFNGDNGSRHILCAWFFGTGSTKEMTHAQVRAMFKIMDIKYDGQHVPTFDSAPSAESMKELHAALEFAIKAGGK